MTLKQYTIKAVVLKLCYLEYLITDLEYLVKILSFVNAYFEVDV